MTEPLHRNAAVILHGAEALEELRSVCRSLIYATLITDDGFEVSGLVGVQHNRMASMASSMQALGDAVARELQIGTSEYIIIASHQGHVIQLRIPGQPLVLSALFGNEETLGKALSSARSSAARMSMVLASIR